MRRQCAYTAMTVAEHLRNQGKSVLLLMDDVTRFCLTPDWEMRHMTPGKPTVKRGCPPSVFTELPRLLKRASTIMPRPKWDGRAARVRGLLRPS